MVFVCFVCHAFWYSKFMTTVLRLTFKFRNRFTNAKRGKVVHVHSTFLAATWRHHDFENTTKFRISCLHVRHEAHDDTEETPYTHFRNF